MSKRKLFINCKQCGKEFLIFPYQKNTKKFCSKECYYQWMSENKKGKNNHFWKGGKIIKKCKQCKKRFEVKLSNKKTKFCSKKCYYQWESENLIGEKSNFWKKGKINKICKQCKKDFKVYPSEKEKTKFCSKKCYNEWLSENIKGKNHPNWKNGTVILICKQCGEKFEVLQSKRKQRFCSRKCKEKWFFQNKQGKNCVNWKGGLTPKNKKIRQSKEYKNFVQKIFKKVNYTCQISKEIGGNLQVHHIKSFAKILEENNITTKKQAKECKELWDENNVIVLNEEWHLGIKTDNPNAFHRLYGTMNFTEKDFYEWFEEFSVVEKVNNE